jgi:hypothetical protein
MRNILDTSHPLDNEPYFVLLESAKDVVRVTARMYDILNRFGNVTLADVKNLLGLKPTYADTKTGWTNIDLFSVQSLSKAIQLIFPETNWKLN